MRSNSFSIKKVQRLFLHSVIDSSAKMKTIFVLSAVALILCFFTEANASVGVEERDCEPGTKWTENCIEKHCSSDGKYIHSTTCGWPHCADGSIPKSDNPSADFPMCCPQCPNAK